MRILYLCHRIPYPPNKGDKIRSFHQIRALSQRHTVHLACLIDDPEDRQHARTLERYCASVDVAYRGAWPSRFRALRATLTSRPLSVATFYSPRLQEKVRQRLAGEPIELVFAFSSAMAEYARGLRLPCVMDFVDVDSEKWRAFAEHRRFPFSSIYRLEADRLLRYESDVARSFDHSILVTDAEAELFSQRTGASRVSAIPNGVDLEYFTPRARPTDPSPTGIVFTGMMDYFPNIDAVQYFCNEILTQIQAIVPQATFYIVGRDPTLTVKSLARLPNVEVTGSVPDVRPYLERALVGVAPFRIARGVQNKVLEAMAAGLPVVGTKLAFQGIPATDSDGVRAADDPQQFARHVLELFRDRALWQRTSGQARAYVERNHCWDDHGTRLEAILREQVNGAGDHGSSRTRR